MRFFTFLFLTVFLYGCGGTSENSNTTANTKPANSNAATVNANNPLATTKTPEAVTTNSAPTLAPVLAGYYAALNKKDEAGTKKFLSQAALKYWEDEAKTEKKTAFVYLLESEEPLNEKREIRNEKIEGDKAFAEIKGGSLGVWTATMFVKENGEWKFASPEDSFKETQNLPKTSTNSNSAR
jgi:hypothetical protein